MIEIIEFGKRYDQLQVLQQISLHVAPGATLVIVGASGCGKSTLLRHIAGIENIDSGPLEGHIRVGQLDDITRIPDRELARKKVRGPFIGLLFQEGALFDTLDVYENLAWPLRENTPLSTKQIARRIEDAIHMVEMNKVEGVLHKSVMDLSGGQKRRIALARALVLQPRVMLYDEPTAGLDPPVALGISRLIRRLQRERGLTSVVATHDMLCAQETADQLMMIDGGKAVFIGSLEDALEDPHVNAFMQGGISHGAHQPV